MIHLPTGFSSTGRYPLVLLFHGGGGTGTKILQQTDFGAKADAEEFIVAAPNGIDNQWADGRRTTGPDKLGVDDVSFVRQLISDLETRLPIDTTRIYASGASNGGMMTERLGCELSGELAAIAPDVGPMPSNLASGCKPEAIPFLGIQGGADPLVPLDGGTVKSSAALGSGGVVQSANQTMQLWASVDGCEANPSVTHLPPAVGDGTSVDQYTYSGCDGTNAVVYYIVQGMGTDGRPIRRRIHASPATHRATSTRRTSSGSSSHLITDSQPHSQPGTLPTCELRATSFFTCKSLSVRLWSSNHPERASSSSLVP